MAFDIRAIFGRALGGRNDRESQLPVAAPEEMSDEEMPGSPIAAAGSYAASPNTDDMSQGGATNATALLPEGMAAIPSAAVDRTHEAEDDDAVGSEQAALVAEVAIMAAMVEGGLDDEGREDLLESLHEIPGLEEIDDDEIDAIAARLTDGFEGADDFVAAMEDRLDDLASTLADPVLRRAAYQLAVYFSAWDGVLSDAENDLLAALAEAFEIPDLEARGLREATIMEVPEGLAIASPSA